MPRGSDLLEQAGVEGVSDDPYECELCRDTGWVVGKAEHNGFMLETAKRCTPCAVKDWDKQMGKRFKPGLTWEAWVKRPELRDQVKALWTWEGDPWCVLMHGSDERGSDNRGAGKTHAALATGRKWVEKGWYVRAWHWPTLMDRMRESITDYAQKPAPLDDWEGLLVIDDLGERDVEGQPARPPTRWEVELLTTLITAREAASRPTIITTNLGPRELDRKFYRAADRMAAGLRLRWVADSWRRK